MSRTYRRTQKHLARDWLRTRSEEARDPSYLLSGRRRKGLTFDQAYDRSKAYYHRDHHSGKFGVPREFRRNKGSKKIRLLANRGLHQGVTSGEWESHACENRARGAAWWWY